MRKHFLELYTFLLLFYQCLGNISQNVPMLLYSTTNDIRIVNTTHTKIKSKILIKNLTDGASLDYHYKDKKICWTDHGLESIQCTSFNAVAAEDKVEVISTGVMSPDGLACDWFTNKLYWTDSEANKIEVACMKHQHRKVLFWTDLDQPRAIVLDPMERLMFWTDWGEYHPKIERAGMNGDPTTRQVILSEREIYWPNGLSIDYEKKYIYWLDGKLLFIKRMDYNGNNVIVILNSASKYPFALTQIGSKLYWTDWSIWSIYEYEKDVYKEPKEFIHSDVVPMDIQIWDPRRQPYDQTHGCEINNGGCSHLCLLSPKNPGYSCACPIGIKLINNVTCADEPQEMLVFVRRTEMCIIYLDSPDYTHQSLKITNMKHSVAVDYDPVNGFIYWSDSIIKKIQRARLNGTEQSDVLSFEIDSSDGIAIDWVARNIYWTESGLDRIEVATLDGVYRRVIIYSGLLDPRAIAVAPELGWIFWSDWHNKTHKIERANMDGSERLVIVSDDLGWANGIALDVENLKIYWCDAKNDLIEFSNMDGTDRRVLINDIPHPFGFTLMGNYLYWTDWQSRTITRVHKETGGNKEIILEQMPNMMGLKAINGSNLQYQNYSNVNPCGVNNGGCSQLCLYLHNKSYICTCQIGYELLPDRKTCIQPKAFLLFSKRDAIGRISIESGNNEFELPINGIKHVSSIDYDPINNRIYWSDIKQRAILRAYVNGSDPQKVVELGLATPEGLAVDGVALNIYWSDPDAHKIEVSRLDGSSRRVLLWNNENVKPQSIILDPQEGYMYWIECSVEKPNCYIKRGAMDGSNVKKLIINLEQAESLTLDYEKRNLYWIETKSAIMTSNIDGLYKKVLLKNGKRLAAITLHKDYLYYATENGEVIRINCTSGEDAMKIHDLNSTVTDLIIIPNLKRNEIFNECAVNNGGCSHLCLALPAGNRTTYFTCACPTHYTLQNNTCIPPKQFMIYSHKNLVVRLLPDTSECPQAVLPIQGLRSVKAIDFDPVLQFLYWIEGKNRSIKKAKAIGTHTSIVVPGHQDVFPEDIAVDALGRLLFWSCSKQNVINVTKLDNSTTVGIVVSGDKPRLIALHPSKRLIIYTDIGTNPQIIRKRMDGTQKIVISKSSNVVAIAVDSESDLVVWAQNNKIFTCNIDGENQHSLLEDVNLRTGPLAIHSGWLYWLDQRNLRRFELKTGSSPSSIVEHDVNITDLISVTQPDKYHACAQMHTQKCSHLCIVNGTNAICACPQFLTLQSDKITCAAIPECGPGFFDCGAEHLGDKDCIPEAWKCDGQKDCQDGSDEAGCSSCKGQFRCNSGECIDPSLVCNDNFNCKDRSDEEICCKNAYEFQCPGTNVCIPKSNVCDGSEHCADGADEKKSACPDPKSDPIGLFGIVFWVFMSIISAIIVFFIVFYYIKRNLYVNNVNATDQSGDPLNPVQNRNQIKTQKIRGKAIPDVIHMSMLKNADISSYDRDNITGASSSTNESSVTGYPRETLNPPPSPATTAASTRVSSPTARYRPYKHYRAINQPPPPTPCSTDVCDESDYNYPTNGTHNHYDERNRYDVGPFPPPPTPRSHCNSESCPPSPSSRSSTYFSPLPPPPSPVASPPRSYS